MSEVTNYEIDYEDQQEVQKVILLLERITNGMKQSANAIFLATFAHFVFLLGIFVTVFTVIDGKATGLFYLLAISVEASLLFFSIGHLYAFEQTIKQGNVYYQEISDSFEWNSSPPSGKLAARVILKNFVISGDLPFISGSKASVIAYVFSNFGFTFMVGWLLFRTKAMFP
ncbi:hypothetical protein FV218_06610 [Methylobacterium sp. WL69]|uniref:hypothetical protein n=1 Tax=Methylobacterium sp. WL69 TaxID=2603893 RepID=UPI0011C80F1A|nr:hypothetical protein [Methylobacterium sp. WL69]TXM76610.1 hypothetical protein FV218_06610 [Methylobacterium sp. WL69]